MGEAAAILVYLTINIHLPGFQPASSPNFSSIPDDLRSFLWAKKGRDPLDVESLIRQARKVLKRLQARRNGHGETHHRKRRVK